MCQRCNDPLHPPELTTTGAERRAFLGAAAAGALAVLGPRNAAAESIEGAARFSNAELPARAWGAAVPGAPLRTMAIQRRAPRVDDVDIDILYCGVCHSDIHMARGEWSGVNFPIVPGHEIIGRVRDVGDNVTRLKVGDTVGIGCMVDSCGERANCRRGLEQYCQKAVIYTYNSPETGTGKNTLGGYSDRIVVTEKFVIKIPDGADLAATAPLLCAGVTTTSPMNHWKVDPGQKVGIIGVGGLGHVAAKIASSRGAEVTIFTTSPSKLASAQHLGASAAYLWSDKEAFKRLAGQFSLLISTVPQAYPMQPFMDLLDLDATLVNVGALEVLEGGVDGRLLARRRKSIAGSLIGSLRETQDLIDYCVARNIKADIEMIPISRVNEAYDRIMSKDVRYRFVIDMKTIV
jgi:uncharacterized zinc-type alcohol dehydrogenase-like protein